MLPRATFRKTPEDFVVEELAAYEPSGEGEHLFVHLRKRRLTTLEAVRRICSALGADERGAGYAGMKDREGVTTQTISVPFPLGRDGDEALRLSLEGIEILGARRHGHKLKPGHLVGNRFAIALRDLPPEAHAALVRLGESATREGIPNGFGPQRFGRDGDNPDRALAWLSGRAAGPRDRREQRLLFSALQAHLFNELLSRRVADGTYRLPLAGDVLKKHDSGGLFTCEDPELDRARADRGEVSPTGPIFGAKMRWPSGRPAELEREVLSSIGCTADAFDRWRKFGEGSRRSLRLFASEFSVSDLSEGGSVLLVRFVLPKGGYATTVLSQAVSLHEEASR